MRANISRTELFAFVRSLGGNPHETHRIEIDHKGITVEAYRVDEQGRHMVAGDEIAMEVTVIPIVGNDGDQPTVRMRHPNLDTEVDVPATAVGQHAVAGWEVVGDEPPAEEQPAEQGGQEQPEPSAPEDTQSAPRGRRKSTKEG